MFSLTPPSQLGGSWTETVLYNFSGPPNDGQGPQGLVIGSGGVLYGTTGAGGTGNTGNVYSLTPPSQAGGAWTETVLHNFSAHSTNRLGIGPSALVVAPKSGVLYGATEYNGYFASGTLYSLTPPGSTSLPGSAWVYTRLVNFDPPVDGEFPISLVGRDGVFYGTTGAGGAYGFGTVFSFVP